MSKHALTISALLLLLVGCQKFEAVQSEANQDLTIPTPPVYQTADINVLFNAAQVFCDRPDCPGYVGMAISKEPGKGVALCTVSLLDSTTVITNAHCLPAAVTDEGAPCDFFIDVLFPRTSNLTAERVSCAEVVSVSKIAKERSDERFLHLADYAILRLKTPVHRPTLKVNKSGVPDNEPLTIYSATPLTNTAPWSKITRRNCTSRQGTAKWPAYSHPHAQVITMGACENLEHGESGSPVLNNNGEAVAFAHGSMQVSSAQLKNRTIDTRLSYATNAACIEFPTSIAAPGTHPDCQKETSVDDFLMQLNAHADFSLLQANLDEWAKSNSDYFEWDFEKVNSTTDPHLIAVTPKPRCIKAISQWPRQPNKASGLLSWFGRDQYSIATFTPIWYFKGDVDQNMRLVLTVRNGPEVDDTIEFYVEDISKLKSPMPIAMTRKVEKQTEKKVYSVGICQ